MREEYGRSDDELSKDLEDWKVVCNINHISNF